MTVLGREPREIADEYVLGLLDPWETAEVEAALASDPALARAVAAASDRMLELDTNTEGIEPSAELWAGIRERLRQDEPPPASYPRRQRDQRSRPASRRTRQARRVAALGWAAALLLGAVLLWQNIMRTAPEVVAVLLDEAGTPLVVVEDYGDDSARITLLEAFEIPQGRALQLWTLPDPETGPVSLGLLRQADSTTLTGPDLPPPAPEQLYEITLEDEAGSPTGRPTGPVLVKGFARVPQ